jgi:hypothetical protein
MDSIINKRNAFNPIFHFLEDISRRPMEMPPESELKEAELPPEGQTILVEMALNSRCSIEYDGNPNKFHWGVFDRKKKLSKEQIKEIVDLAPIPRLTGGKLGIKSKDNTHALLIDNHTSAIEKKRMMVESGMQQQAVGLICFDLGVGAVINNHPEPLNSFGAHQLVLVNAQEFFNIVK